MSDPSHEDRFGVCDDSLDECDPAPAAPEARPWLAQQRFVHGLLRAASTADASAREARIQTLMASLPAHPRRWTRLLAPAAAVLVLGAVVAWTFTAMGRLPRAEAMVAKALASLQAPVDRAFELEVTIVGPDRQVERTLEVVMRPGRRFLVQGRTWLGPFRAGCDGDTVWFEPALPLMRTSVPLAEAHRLTERLGDVLDLGYLDLETLLRRLPQDAALRCTGREGGAVRIEAIGDVRLRQVELRSIRMLVEDGTGLLLDVQAAANGTRRGKPWQAHLAYRHLGTRALGEDGYRRPW